MTIGTWISLTCTDAAAEVDWLRAVGFTEHATYPGEKPGTVAHAELVWPDGGGVMLGTYHHSTEWPVRPGTGATYLTTDAVDDTFEAAVKAGGRPLRAPHDQDYGREASVADPEGNLWSFGDYRPV